MKRKVLHIGESIHGGGSESVLRDTLIALREEEQIFNHEVILKKSDKLESSINYFFENKNKGKLSQIFSVSNYKKLKSVLQKSKPNVIHVHHYANLSPSIFLAILKYKKKKSIKVIHTSHTFEYVCSISAGYHYNQEKRCTDCSTSLFKFKVFKQNCSRLGLFHSYGKGISSLIFSYFMNKKAVDYWTTPSSFLRDKMLQQPFITNDKITVLRNPILNVKKAVKLVTKPTDVFNFIYFGRFSEEKDIECIINAFKTAVSIHPNFKLILVGKGDKEESLKGIVNKERLQDKVSFVGFLSKEKLMTKLETCHISLLSSKCYENAPMIVTESIQSNLLPIVCNHGGMKEMVDICNVGLTFKSGDENDLSEQMIYAYKNYNKLLKDIDRVKGDKLKVFMKENYLQELNKIYKKLS